MKSNAHRWRTRTDKILASLKKDIEICLEKRHLFSTALKFVFLLCIRMFHGMQCGMTKTLLSSIARGEYYSNYFLLYIVRNQYWLIGYTNWWYFNRFVEQLQRRQACYARDADEDVENVFGPRDENLPSDINNNYCLHNNIRVYCSNRFIRCNLALLLWHGVFC